MATAPQKDKVHGPTHDGEKICHIVPEDDPDTALCGKDVTGWPWNPPWPFCVVCLDLAGYEVRGGASWPPRRRSRCSRRRPPLPPRTPAPTGSAIRTSPRTATAATT